MSAKPISVLYPRVFGRLFDFLSSRRAFRAVRGPDAKAAARVRDCSRAFPRRVSAPVAAPPSAPALAGIGGKPGKLSSVLLTATEIEEPTSFVIASVACAFLVYMLPPLPRRSGWAYSSLISPSRVSLPRKGHRLVILLRGVHHPLQGVDAAESPGKLVVPQ